MLGGRVTQQRLRLILAGALAIVTTVSVVLLAVLHDNEPDTLRFVLIAALGFLFGTLTNGSGIGTPPQGGKQP